MTGHAVEAFLTDADKGQVLVRYSLEIKAHAAVFTRNIGASRTISNVTVLAIKIFLAFAAVFCDAVDTCAVVLTLAVATFVDICPTFVARKTEVAFACSVSGAGAVFADDVLTDGEFAACLADESVLANAVE